MKKILMTRLSVCSLGVSCNEMIDTPMLLVVSYGPLVLWSIGSPAKYQPEPDKHCCSYK